VLHIIEASPAEYREISSADVLGGAKRPRRFAVPPVLCGGMIYYRNYASDLVFIDVCKEGWLRKHNARVDFNCRRNVAGRTQFQ
jgi:hypothetical protein